MDPRSDVDSGPKSRKIIYNDNLEATFVKIKQIFSADILPNDNFWGVVFTVHTDASYNKLSIFISKDNKPIAFLSRRSRKYQHNYTTTEK